MDSAAREGGQGPMCPDYLGVIGRQAWGAIRDVARNAGIIDEFGYALELAAAAYEEYRLCKAELGNCSSDAGSQAEREIYYEEMTQAWKRCCSALALFAIRPPSRVEPWRDPLRGILPDVGGGR